MKKLYNFLVTSYKLQVTRAPHLTPHTSYLTPQTSYLKPLTSNLLPLTPYLIPLTSYLLPLTPYLFLLSAFCFFSAGAQNNNPADEYQYVPIPNNHIWSVNTMKFKTHGDTVINNKEYLKVYRDEKFVPSEFDMNSAKYYCALRNDYNFR